MQFVKRHKTPVRRRSTISKGFPGTYIPPEGSTEDLRPPKERKEEKLRYSKSLSDMKTLFDERKLLKKSLSTNEINVGDKDVLSDSGEFSADGEIIISPTSASAGHFNRQESPKQLSGMVRPRSRSETLPQTMASAERIYGSPENRHVSRIEVPFGSLRGRNTPVSILRAIKSPPRQTLHESRAGLLSSPAPWGNEG